MSPKRPRLRGSASLKLTSSQRSSCRQQALVLTPWSFTARERRRDAERRRCLHGAGDKPGFGRSLVLRGLMSMMCAVVSCPFWAGWLNKITAHTPASNPPFNQRTSAAKSAFNEIDSNWVRNHTFFMSFVQKQPDGLSAAVGVVERQIVHPHRDKPVS